MLSKNNSFVDLGLKHHAILNALKDFGYKIPSPIQLRCIPYLLAGRDVLGMAQTGSGKTAAFVLPLLHNVNPKLMVTQVLILAPTRELAIQVSTVCSEFSKYIDGIHIVPLYGGQRYDIQFRALSKGAHIVVGTPGRLLDHLNRGTLNLFKLRSLVLDEADEMLRMGFIDDVENILSKVPIKRQTALFSATLPIVIKRVINRFMNNPQEVFIHSGISVCSDVRQYYCPIYGTRKSEALMRFLETENFDAVIVFVRTKSSTVEVNEILEHNGYNSAALNGDMNQILRQQTLNRFKNGKLDILIATDIAARGLDVGRISLVINYDIPLDVESYVHRIGRTGRAGRIGNSLLFVGNYEFKLLRNIERGIHYSIPEVQLPSSDTLNVRRLEKFSAQVQMQLQSDDLNIYLKLLSKIKLKTNLDIEDLAAVFLKMVQGSKRLIVSSDLIKKNVALPRKVKANIIDGNGNGIRYNKKILSVTCIKKNMNKKMSLYRIELGRDHGIKMQHILGAIHGELNINVYIGTIKLFSSYSTIELSRKIPDKILSDFNRIRILNKPINIRFLGNVLSRRNIT
ncbi:DEAD/DEAH box helicase [Blochmannia endosymbiont of Camponotus (Colobopsis) obliquus]|uniref:DEAD/DEAH box helicase n=1 Tax=Blochmannia endosymbiont of Camponotus (Colobopsis) obliquus TaxID=1505597 RepID=UPI00061A7BCB|nr:DEAD/DEAH box helicase [Blochmannia endosymbiont of Camponotus (Colobopsis) obliquus]AKC60286.1 cold-shock DEAD box protein A [Blochmannia endosymbiont of Camponotus (Colobopsis) obliquus]